MNFRKNSTLMIGCGIALVLFVVALIFLIRFKGTYQEHASALESAQTRLLSLNQRNPFPSAENIKLAGENLELLKSRYGDLQNQLIATQIKSEAIEPAGFAPMLEQAVRRLSARSTAAGVAINPELGLGFKEYTAGKLPPNDPATMERLVVQIRALEDLINLLVDAKVQSIDTIQRDQFDARTETVTETPGEMRGRGRGALAPRAAGDTAPAAAILPGVPLPAPNELYQVERFVIGFTGRENAVWDVLNRLGSSRIVYVVSDITLDNTRLDLGRPVDLKSRLAAIAATSTPQTGATAPSVAGAQMKLEDISREERVVGGREPIKVRIAVDMFRLLPPSPGGQTP